MALSLNNPPLTVQDEGITQGVVSAINFAGADVTTSVTNSIATVTIAASSSVASGSALVNFGTVNSRHQGASISVTGQTGITLSSIVNVSTRIEATANHSIEEILSESPKFSVGNLIVGVGFTIYGSIPRGRSYGDFPVNWSWV